MKKILLAIAVVFSVILLTGCTGKKVDPIVGSWKIDYAGSKYVYTFNEDKTGTYDAAGTKMEFTWEIKEDKLSILYTGNTAPFETTYKIEGKKLTIKDSLDKDVVYEKQ